jgi:hypothetical protein
MLPLLPVPFTAESDRRLAAAPFSAERLIRPVGSAGVDSAADHPAGPPSPRRRRMSPESVGYRAGLVRARRFDPAARCNGSPARRIVPGFCSC